MKGGWGSVFINYVLKTCIHNDFDAGSNWAIPAHRGSSSQQDGHTVTELATHTTFQPANQKRPAPASPQPLASHSHSHSHSCNHSHSHSPSPQPQPSQPASQPVSQSASQPASQPSSQLASQPACQPASCSPPSPPFQSCLNMKRRPLLPGSAAWALRPSKDFPHSLCIHTGTQL